MCLLMQIQCNYVLQVYNGDQFEKNPFKANDVEQYTSLVSDKH